jgi:hypothetical protein
MNTALLVFFYIFLFISMIGAINWGLIGTFGFNLVAFISNRSKSVERGLYITVGFSGIVLLILTIIVLSTHQAETFMLPVPQRRDDEEEESHRV